MTGRSGGGAYSWWVAALDERIKKFNANPQLAFYKIQTNAYKFSWALIPIRARTSRGIRRSVTRIANASALGATGPTRLWLDADGVHEQCAGLTTSALWPVLGRIEESGEHAYIFVSPVAAFVVPKRAGTERVNAFLNSVRACQQSMNTSLDSAG